MARERSLRTVEVSLVPELRRIVQQLRNGGEPLVLQEDHKDVAIVRTIGAPRRARQRRGRALTEKDSLWKLVGSATAAQPTDASRTHEYLNEATGPIRA